MREPGSVIWIGYAPPGISSSGPLVVEGDLNDPWYVDDITSLKNKGYIFIKTVVVEDD